MAAANLVGNGAADLSLAVREVLANNPEPNEDYSDDEHASAPVLGTATDLISLHDGAGALQLHSSSSGANQLSVFSSAAADYFQQREFQGLVAEVPVGHDTAIHPGTFGTSVGYRQNV